METPNEALPIIFKIKTGNPALFSDVMNFYSKVDDHCILCFGSTMPTRNEKGEVQIEAYEQARIIVTNEHAKRIADLICQKLEYYPVKAKPTKKEKAPVLAKPL